jgi:transcriptional regulator with XRE-family HTH domain
MRSHNPDHHSDGHDNDPGIAKTPFVERLPEHAVTSNSLGEELRNVRQSKRLELSHVSSRLKISKRYLKALEENDLEMLPVGKAYRLGFASTYAAYLGLNTTRCLEKLKIEIAEREAKREIPDSINQMHEPRVGGPLRRTVSYLNRKRCES